jgi:hypothetical protein
MRRALGCLFAAAVLGSTGPAARADFMFTYADNTYLVVTTPTTWTDAAAAARSLTVGGRPGALVRIDDAAENAAIIAQLLANIPAADFNLTRAPDGGNGAYVWIGAQDITTDGVWIWDGDFDGVGPLLGTGVGPATPNPMGAPPWMSSVYFNWGPTGPAGGPGQREPDNSFGGAQDAAGISLSGWPFGSPGQWNDVIPTNRLFYVVEFEAAAVPEPASVALAAAGLGVVAARRRLRAR